LEKEKSSIALCAACSYESPPIQPTTNLPARQALSEDDDDEDVLYHNTLSNARGYTSADDLEEDEDNLPAESADLLQLEKVIKAGYLLKKGEKRRVSFVDLGLT
jgi:hypothetical protein